VLALPVISLSLMSLALQAARVEHVAKIVHAACAGRHHGSVHRGGVT